jgi:hypothetical protein
MRKLGNYTCHLMCLTLALGGLTSGAALMFGPAVVASAQVIGSSWTITGNLNTAR